MLKRPNSSACALETTASFLAIPVPCFPGPREDARSRKALHVDAYEHDVEKVLFMDMQFQQNLQKIHPCLEQTRASACSALTTKVQSLVAKNTFLYIYTGVMPMYGKA